jgi:hypothetical protein
MMERRSRPNASPCRDRKGMCVCLKWTWRHVIEHGALAFECGNCRHLAQVDVLDLVAKFGPEAIVGLIRVRMVCRRCWEATSSVAGTAESRPQGSRVGYQCRRARGDSAG